ncbi:mitochondrial ribosomal protein L43 [Leptinotarsa decemlineata]|uniref:mitochondrial ribosomal protein L43 n=1 Tax=Leptinotarsa decemlineata TaxID=7539 RepID=UPI000C254E46|nr:39S ribosomal protein L43, mitochondrial [Leptinotarsa decemlineata]
MSNSQLFLKPGFINVPLQNGVGRYVIQLQRVVLKFCKNNGSSRGMREFIEYDLMNFAKENPGIVVYLKPRRHRTAVMKAEYLNGDQQWLSCRNFTREEIMKWLNLFKTQQKNHTGTRIRKLFHTDHPSIQGPWTPFTFRNPALNLAVFPNEKLSEPENLDKSSVDELVELFKKQKLEELENARATN